MPLNPPLRDWPGRCVWVVGASSGIGRATASLLHAKGAAVVVTARNASALQAFTLAHPGSIAISADATAPGALRNAAAEVLARRGRLDVAMYCAGTFAPMRATAFDLGLALDHQRTNTEGALRWLDAVLPHVLGQAHRRPPVADGPLPHLSLVASVAGYRGLPKGLAYGPTKAALIHLAETLYLDLHALGLGVSVINPGFVQTPLTAQNDFPMPALITPEQAALEIVRGWEAGRFELHFPKRFSVWLKLARHLGYGSYFRSVRAATRL